MAREPIHISEAEAASDFGWVMAQVRAGAEVVIECDRRPVAVIHPAESQLRLLSQSLLIAKDLRPVSTLDDEFSRDLQKAVKSHYEGITPPAWD